MSRFLKVAAAQMGPNPEGTPRDVVVERMLALLEQAIVEDVELLVYPELALAAHRQSGQQAEPGEERGPQG
jgi:N-carbamoyl-D-amino-acid hydrolase